MAFLCDRQKLILLADKSPLGWKTVLQYKHRDLADDDEDEKKIYRAESRAARVVSVPLHAAGSYGHSGQIPSACGLTIS